MSSSKEKDELAAGRGADGEWVGRAERGDVTAFNLLVRKWEKPLYNFTLRLTGNREDALDLTQDSFLKAYSQLRQLQSREKFSHWLFKIALNLFYSSKRSARNSPTLSLDEEIGDGLSWADALVSEESKKTPGFEALLLERERARKVRKAVFQLNAEQRAATILKIYYGMKFEEIAEIVNCPVSTVKSRLYAAMENLQKALKEWMD